MCIRDSLRHVIISYMIRPNVILLVQDGLLDVFQFLPEGPDRTISLVTRYVAEPPATEEAADRLRRSFERLLDTIDREDYEMCEQTQRSFASGAQRALVFGRNEPGLIHYHRAIEWMLDEHSSLMDESPVQLRAVAD